MSWSIHPEIKSMAADQAEEALANQAQVPEVIKQYLYDGIGALQTVHGTDVLVTVTGHGHLCTGQDYDVTSATVDVRKATP